jgi:CheY-like chemotaxis protein
MRVLLVDDDPMVGKLVSRQLRAWGCEPVLASSVDEALGRLAAEPFDLVLSDIQMPEKDGFALMERVRGSWPDTRVILMSGQGAPGVRERSLEAGASRFLAKPFSRSALGQALGRLPSPFR